LTGTNNPYQRPTADFIKGGVGVRCVLAHLFGAQLTSNTSCAIALQLRAKKSFTLFSAFPIQKRHFNCATPKPNFAPLCSSCAQKNHRSFFLRF